jgi:hypothetical protein
MRLTFLLATSLALTLFGAVNVPAATQDELILENDLYRLEFDRQHGRLLRLLDKAGRIDLKSSEQTAGNFRLLIPLTETARSSILGKNQTLSRSQASPNKLTLHWDGPMKDDAGRSHDIAATMRIELEGKSVVFRFDLTNRTKHKIEEVWYPAIGGLLAFGPPESRQQVQLNPPPHYVRKLRRPFGRHLIPYPTTNMGFVEVENPAMRRSMYLGAHDPIARFKGFYFLESGSGENSNVAAHLVHYPFTPPGGRFEGAPFVVQFHDGDWVAGGKQIYRPWFIKQFGLMTPDRDWIRRQSFFQMVMVMLPEGNVNYKFNEIPQLARDGLKYGVTALQIAGWQRGGHDNGYPYYEPDPRLGTWDDLEKAIHECHKLGVKIYFFVNTQVCNVDTAWYQRELKDYNFETTQGAISFIYGWGMGTLASRMFLTTPLMTYADVSFPGLADGQLPYFKKLARIGADGLHIDKSYPEPMNFNPRITMSPDASPWEGTIRMTARIDRECRAIRPDFRISFETTWDRVLSYGAATWWGHVGNMSNARRVFPELAETVGIYQPYDYIGINDAVRRGHAVMVSPHHFNRSMDCPTWRGLASYIRDVKKIRDTLADYVFTGEPVDVALAKFSQNQKFPPGVEWAVYRNPKNKKLACIVTNRTRDAQTVTLESLGDGKNVRVYHPGKNPAPSTLPVPIAIAPERLVFIVEQ